MQSTTGPSYLLRRYLISAAMPNTRRMVSNEQNSPMIPIKATGMSPCIIELFPIIPAPGKRSGAGLANYFLVIEVIVLPPSPVVKSNEIVSPTATS